ncbi:MAG: heme exporter protein CcmB [Planctomycetales bacterium]|nr:heme exporter protein CcmB [Planctomycetales bacterium]
MMSATRISAKFCWIVHKDLVREFRSRQIAPRMLLLGATLCLLLTQQAGRIPGQLQEMAASLCWMTLGFVAVLTLGPSVSRERDQGCWTALLSYPVPTHVVFLSKVAFNSVVFGAAQLLIVPLFVLMCDSRWCNQPGALALVLALGNIGITSAGTLMSVVSAEVDQGEGLLAVLFFPLLVPVLLAASEATRLLGDHQAAAEWSRWVQLLAAFSVVYLTVGWMLFEHMVED